MPIDEPTREAYETLARERPDWSDEPHRTFLEWPATRSLLPEVSSKRVLDAGCGTGDYAEWLVERGATVVGVDATGAAIRRARERLRGADAEFHHADLTDPLDFLADGSVDLVVSLLVLSHVEDWRSVFAEFFRVLRPGGAFVFSTGHPVSGWVNPEEAEEYFETERLTQDWGDVQPRNYRRPLGEHLNPLAEAGFVLERLLEPTPQEAYRDHHPEKYDALTEVPRWECIRARKPEHLDG